MRFKETSYSIFDQSINSILLESVDLNQWIDSGVKNICVVLDTQENNRLVHCSGNGLDEKNRMNLSFNDLYDMTVDMTEDKLVMIKSLYNHVPSYEILEIINKQNKIGLMIDYLNNTNSYLIYHHQFERFLVNEMDYAEKEAVELRKSWNKKVNIKKQEVISNSNYLILKGLMPFEFTFNQYVIIEHKF